jgi:hypothetical protein
MPAEGTNPRAGVNVPEVVFVARFWVSTEAYGERFSFGMKGCLLMSSILSAEAAQLESIVKRVASNRTPGRRA